MVVILRGTLMYDKKAHALAHRIFGLVRLLDVMRRDCGATTQLTQVRVSVKQQHGGSDESSKTFGHETYQKGPASFDTYICNYGLFGILGQDHDTFDSLTQLNPFRMAT